MQSDLTTQSADIIPAWIGNRHRRSHTDALLQKYTLAVIFTFSFLPLRGNKWYQMHIFTVYLLYDALDISKDFKDRGKLQHRWIVLYGYELIWVFSSSHTKPQKKILNSDAVR